MNVDPGLWAKDVPVGSNPGTWKQSSPFNWKTDLMNAAPSLANVLRPRGDFAIIGPGGGVDVLRAIANGSRNVTGIEINPLIANTIMRNRYADYAHHLYQLADVHIHVADGRSYLRSSRDQYDVVQMTLVDTWASTAAGAYALSENNLYTVEAFREYFDHLRPDGMIAITRWEFRQPREALRVVSQATEALHQLGVTDPRENFIVASDVDRLLGSGTTWVTITPSATLGPYDTSSSARAWLPTKETLLKSMSGRSSFTLSMNFAAAL